MPANPSISLSRNKESGAFGRRHFFALLAATTVLGLLLRLGVGLQLLKTDPSVTRPASVTDMYTYQNFAGKILDGTYSWKQGFYYQPFYYAVFLPGVYTVFGRQADGVVWVQAFLGAACVWLTGLAFAQLFGRRVGLSAAVLLALCRTHIFYTPYCLIAILQGFWLSFILYLAVCAWRRRHWWLWGGAGLVFGCSIATRGNMLLLMPLLPLLAWARLRQKPRRVVGIWLLLAVCMYLPQLPFALVNYRATGHWTGPSTAAAAVLALGNTPEAPPGGREPGTGAGPMEYPESCQFWTASASRADSGAVSIYRRIFTWAAREPGAYLELKFRTLLLFWQKGEIPNNVAMTSRGRRLRAPLLWLPILLNFWLIGSLALVGSVESLWRYHGRVLHAFPALSVWLYAGSIAAFYMLARFRVPILPLLCGCAGYALIRIVDAARLLKTDGRRAWPVLGGAAAAFLVVCAGYDLYRFGWESRIMRLVRPNGVQVQLAHEWVVRDTGPLTFGGWSPQPLKSRMRVEKRLCLPDGDLSLKNARVRLAVSSQHGASLRFFPPDGKESPREKSISSGLRWIEMPLFPGSLKKDGRQVLLRFILESESDSDSVPFLLLDVQRDYGRTRINNQLVPAELLVELRLPR